MTRRCEIACRVALIAALYGCAADRDAYDRGLLAVEIWLEPERLGELYGSTSSGAYLSAVAFLGGERFTADIEAAGGFSLFHVKRSLNVRLRDGAFRGVRSYRLSATETDRSMVRTPLAYDVFARFGFAVPTVTPVAMTVNGRYWGLYYLIERVDEAFFARRELPARALYKAKGFASFFDGMSAHIDTYFESRFEPESLVELERLADLVESASPDALEREIFSYVSRSDFVRYMAAGVLTGHTDGFNKNVYFYSPGLGEPLRIVPWDMDKTWEHSVLEAIRETGRVWQDNVLFERLFGLEGVRAEIIGLVQQALRGEEAVPLFVARVDEARARIARAYADDDALGGMHGLSLEGQTSALIMLYGEWAARLTSSPPVSPLE